MEGPQREALATLGPGDTLVVETAIRAGDVVALERVGPGRVTLRALTAPEAAAWPQRLHVAEAAEGGVALSPTLRGSEPPAWASGLGLAGSERLLGLLRIVLRARWVQFVLDPAGRVEVTTARAATVAQSLVPWAQALGQLPPERWSGVVEHPAGVLIQSALDMEAVERLLSDCDAVLGLLRLRLYHAGHIGRAPPSSTVTFPVGGNLVAALVLDLPSGPTFVDPARAAALGEPPQRLLTRAAMNTRDRRDAWAAEPTELAPGVVATVLSGNEYTATAVVQLDAHGVPPAPQGYLIDLPRPTQLAIHAIMGSEVRGHSGHGQLDAEARAPAGPPQPAPVLVARGAPHAADADRERPIRAGDTGGVPEGGPRPVAAVVSRGGLLLDFCRDDVRHCSDSGHHGSAVSTFTLTSNFPDALPVDPATARNRS